MMVDHTYNNITVDHIQCYYKYVPPSFTIYEGPTFDFPVTADCSDKGFNLYSLSLNMG